MIYTVNNNNKRYSCIKVTHQGKTTFARHLLTLLSSFPCLPFPFFPFSSSLLVISYLLLLRLSYLCFCLCTSHPNLSFCSVSLLSVSHPLLPFLPLHLPLLPSFCSLSSASFPLLFSFPSLTDGLS